MAQTKAKPKKKQTKSKSSASANLGIQEFKKCPKCTADKGFYVYLIPKDNSKKNNFDVRMRCSKCGQRYQIGLILG